VELPDSYPLQPPQVRLLWPMLAHGTGGVVAGCFLIPALFPRGWNPSFDLTMVVAWVRDILRVARARVALDTNAHYNVRSFAAARRRLMLCEPEAGLAHAQRFERTYYLYSSAFALEVMSAPVPADFEAGNKVLLPAAALELLARGELAGMGGRGASGTLRLRPAASSEAFGGEEAMIFEVTSHLGFPVYCGVREFTSPEPDAVIVPQELFASMGVPEGTEVAVRRVRLPAIASAVFEPHSTNFYAVDTFTGLEPKAYLEASLRRFTCLQAGDVILCDGGGEAIAQGGFAGASSFRFNVVAVKPDRAPAAALWADGYATSLSMEFLPAADTYETRHAPRSGAGGSGGVGVFNPDVQAQLDVAAAAAATGNGVGPSGSMVGTAAARAAARAPAAPAAGAVPTRAARSGGGAAVSLVAPAAAPTPAIAPAAAAATQQVPPHAAAPLAAADTPAGLVFSTGADAPAVGSPEGAPAPVQPPAPAAAPLSAAERDARRRAAAAAALRRFEKPAAAPADRAAGLAGEADA
jgi:hypothetical protein